MTVTMTAKQAITAFHEIAGNEGITDEDVDYGVAAIGDPDAELSVTQTYETVEDWLTSNGPGFKWGRCPHLDAGGAVALEQKTEAKNKHYAYIADCGEYRLVYIERP